MAARRALGLLKHCELMHKAQAVDLTHTQRHAGFPQAPAFRASCASQGPSAGVPNQALGLVARRHADVVPPQGAHAAHRVA